MTDAINEACTALREAAATFRDYAEHHRTKSAEPGDEAHTKARIDGERAKRCEAALAGLRAFASGPERTG